ncbi:MAG: Crp/Fnr family transcriptional regulator [Sphaerochaetaceae bacterium]|nr:Crp/Fnr family transcriptional regulator [Spirochaetales bacterium]MDY5500859.1 Crp/Fnr family transcriptional regulator [Sphaerochaetaceae bacterium]
MIDLHAYLTCPLFHLKDMRSFWDIINILDLHEEEFPAGTSILEKGMASKDVLIVLGGTVVEMAGEVPLRALEKNDCFAMTLAVTQNRSALSYLAKTDCVIGHAPIWTLRKNGELMENMMKLMAEEAESSLSRLAILTQKSAREKVSWFLEEQVRLHHSRTFVIPLKKKEIATLLGITPTALYLELRKMEKEGKLKRDHSLYQLSR